MGVEHWEQRVMGELARRHGQLRLAEAAALVGLQPSWFRRRFRVLTGMSFRTAQVQARVRSGLQLVQTTTHNIPDISFLLGYSDRSKFEKAFKRVNGMTPAQYRLQASKSVDTGKNA